MARREVTDEMRETARDRAFAYRAARTMSSAEVVQLADYHAERLERGYRGENVVYARMFTTLQARRASMAVARLRQPRTYTGRHRTARSVRTR